MNTLNNIVRLYYVNIPDSWTLHNWTSDNWAQDLEQQKIKHNTCIIEHQVIEHKIIIEPKPVEHFLMTKIGYVLLITLAVSDNEVRTKV